MSRVPALARRVLIELAPLIALPNDQRMVDASPVRRAFVACLACVEAHAVALAILDRLTEAEHPDDGESVDAASPALRHAQGREARCADAIADAAATLLLAPATRPGDIAAKLVVLIAASEPHPADAHAFPAPYLRALLSDVRGLVPRMLYGRGDP